MKAHLILGLESHIPPVDAPHWQDILADKADARARIHPRIDAILDRYQLPVWVTREYRPAGPDCSPYASS